MEKTPNREREHDMSKKTLTPAEWRAVQHAGKGLPNEVTWPVDQCSRCKVRGEMTYEIGKPLCSFCAENTVIELASPLGLHERSVAAGELRS